MLVRWIEERNPFDRNVDQLRNIETGMAAEKDVNVDRCLEIMQPPYHSRRRTKP